MSNTDWETAKKLVPEILECVDAGNRIAGPTALIAQRLQWAREEGVKLALERRVKDYEELLTDVRKECAKVIGPGAFVLMEPPSGVVKQAIEKVRRKERRAIIEVLRSDAEEPCHTCEGKHHVDLDNNGYEELCPECHFSMAEIAKAIEEGSSL
jgi:hypothetical protein